MLTYEQWQARISQITPELYVSEVVCRAYEPWLLRFGIDTIVSVLTPEAEVQYDKSAPVSAAFKHLTLNYADGDPIDPAALLAIVESFGKVTLVHCISGANRSTCVAIARLLYLGVDPITACHTYWTKRGAQTATVYQAVPRMSRQMLANLVDFYAYLNETKRSR